jgi:hypothetical protein
MTLVFLVRKWQKIDWWRGSGKDGLRAKEGQTMGGVRYNPCASGRWQTQWHHRLMDGTAGQLDGIWSPVWERRVRPRRAELLGASQLPTHRAARHSSHFEGHAAISCGAAQLFFSRFIFISIFFIFCFYLSENDQSLYHEYVREYSSRKYEACLEIWTVLEATFFKKINPMKSHSSKQAFVPFY